jgi:N-acetylmuramoyl-L-alanine amidase
MVAAEVRGKEMNRIVISSGHGLYVRGASGILDEVDEARQVVEQLADDLKYRGIDVVVFHDDVSRSQSENLSRIVDFHNSEVRDLDISVHFNAYEQVSGPMGCEVLYLTQEELAGTLSASIALAGFINRGPKKRTDLYFLNETAAPSVLLEICFVDSEADCEIYTEQFTRICENIADALSGADHIIPPAPEPGQVFSASGECSYFGGPNDTGVSPSEGLAFYDDVMQQPCLFLPYQPEGTTGLARRLNPRVHYVACRWDYDVTPREVLRANMALVRAPATGLALRAFPADWGPHEDTGRVADLSPGLMEDLGIETDDTVEVLFPFGEV